MIQCVVECIVLMSLIKCIFLLLHSSVRCFKWKVRTSGQVHLDENQRRVSDKKLITKVPEEVTFRSPGFFRQNKKHYSNSMFCVYNISLDNCNHIILSSSYGHSLFPDSEDYLRVYLDERPTGLFGDAVGSFSEDISSSSFYAVLWSDAKRNSSEGSFEITARCNPTKAVEVDNGSGSLDVDI